MGLKWLKFCNSSVASFCQHTNVKQNLCCGHFTVYESPLILWFISMFMKEQYRIQFISLIITFDEAFAHHCEGQDVNSVGLELQSLVVHEVLLR